MNETKNECLEIRLHQLIDNGEENEAIKLIDENNQLIWECPNCGNRDTRTMDITRRTCGYKGTARNGWNQGRLGDIHDRVMHLDDIEYGGCDS